jgi:uncharacterized protein (DUF1684 family)
MIMNKDYMKNIEAWRAQMDENLQAPYSWLALFGLFWLQEGDNAIGSAPDAAIRLPERLPAAAGSLHLQDGQLTLQLTGTAPRALRKLGDGEPDYFFVDDIRMALIERGGQLAVRGWDPQHAKRVNFKGRNWYPVDPSYRVSARVEPYEPPKPVVIDDMIGNQNPATMDAALVFKIGGSEARLDAQLLSDGRYDITFKDATAGRGSYPAARFVQSEAPILDLLADAKLPESIVLDFNRAYSPPCAFTDFATCPLPTPENVLVVAIEAGERYEKDEG